MLVLFWESISDDNAGWHGPRKTTSEFIDYHTISCYLCYRKPYAFTKWYYRLQELIRIEFCQIVCPLSLTRHRSSPTRSHSFRQWFSAQNWLIRFDPLITFLHTIQTSFDSISTLEFYRLRLSIQTSVREWVFVWKYHLILFFDSRILTEFSSPKSIAFLCEPQNPLTLRWPGEWPRVIRDRPTIYI